MHPVVDRGIVFSRKKHGESDIRVLLFTRQHGKLFLSLKNGLRAGSKLASLCEPFTLSDIRMALPAHDVYGRLIGGRILNSHRGLRGHVPSFHLAARSVEIVDQLFPFRASHAEVFDMLESAMTSLSRAQHSLAAWILFVVRVLRALGHGDHSGILEARHGISCGALARLAGCEDEGELIESGTLSEVALKHAETYLLSRLSLIMPHQLKTVGCEPSNPVLS